MVLAVLAAGGLAGGSPGRAPSRCARRRPRRAPAGAAAAGAVLNASGYVTARRQATVSSKITGKVVDVLVEEGMEVREGQVLAHLDDATLRRQLALAEAQLASQRRSLAETEVRLRAGEAQPGSGCGACASRGSRRRPTSTPPDAEVDSLAARLDLGARRTCRGPERQLALRRQDLDDTVIRAPFAGVVVSKDAQPGEMISPISAGGGFTRTGICTIVDMDSLEIEVDVNESYINRVRAGPEGEATLDAYPDWQIPAHGHQPVPTADRQKATVKVRIALRRSTIRASCRTWA